jgi:hypothetical protein
MWGYVQPLNSSFLTICFQISKSFQYSKRGEFLLFQRSNERAISQETIDSPGKEKPSRFIRTRSKPIPLTITIKKKKKKKNDFEVIQIFCNTFFKSQEERSSIILKVLKS